MEKSIVDELRKLRMLLAEVVGTADLPESERFSVERVEKAAKEFKKLQAERDEWVRDYDLSKYFKETNWTVGKFIREELEFTRCFKFRSTYYYKKTDIEALAKELKDRNVDLATYMELKSDRQNFINKIANISKNKTNRKGYRISDDMENVIATDAPKPAVDLIKEDLKQLEAEFFQYNLSEYIDIFNGYHAMIKTDYAFAKYYPLDLKSRSRKWCENFNYANHALGLLKQKRTKFIPVPESNMIEL